MKYKKFISNNQLFQLKYPNHWSYFEEENNTYLFLDNDDWKGNLRITPIQVDSTDYSIKNNFVQKQLKDEFENNKDSVLLNIGDKETVFYKNESLSNEEVLLIYNWIFGDETTLYVCSFTIDKNFENNNEIKLELNYAIKTISSINTINT